MKKAIAVYPSPYGKKKKKMREHRVDLQQVGV